MEILSTIITTFWILSPLALVVFIILFFNERKHNRKLNREFEEYKKLIGLQEKETHD